MSNLINRIKSACNVVNFLLHMIVNNENALLLVNTISYRSFSNSTC